MDLREKYLEEAGAVTTKKFVEETARAMDRMKELKTAVTDRTWVSQKGVDRFTKKVSMIRSELEDLLNLIHSHTM